MQANGHGSAIQDASGWGNWVWKNILLNLLCNCETIKKLGFNKASKQLRKFNDSNLENARSREAESKTSGVKMYSIELDKVELKVGIMDTPGFGDTRGFQQDKKKKY